MITSFWTSPTLGVARTRFLDLGARGGVRGLAGKQDTPVEAGGVDMGIFAEVLPYSATRLEFDLLVHQVGAGGAAVVGHDGAGAHAGHHQRVRNRSMGGERQAEQ
jgi:hypothetical protein